MLTIALRGLRANKARYTATLVAIVTGVGFLAAGLIVTDSIRSSLQGDAATQYADVAATVQPDPTASTIEPLIPDSLLETITSAPGVDGAAGELDGSLSVIDPKTAKPVSSGTIGSMWSTDAALNPLRIVDGRAPSAQAEVALDQATADRLDATVGATVDLATITGKQSATVVGITEFGDNATFGQDGTISVAAPWAFALLGDGTPSYTRVLVRGATTGEGQTELVASVKEVTPAGYEVLSRAVFLDEVQGQASAIADLLRPVLVAFSLLALFVCAFVIYNTFSVVVAQRTRELGLLRAIAATPKQVNRSVRTEGLVIGLLGSVLGVAVGVVLTLALPPILSRFGISLTGIGVTVTAGTVVACLLGGTLITIASVLAPAWRAARTPPVEALRSGSARPVRSTTVRTVVSVALLGGGATLLLVGSSAAQGLLLGFGAFVFVMGVLIGGPILAVGFAHLARALTRSVGLAGRLASDNLIRNPRRTATTANALVIGVLLVTFVSTAGGTLRDWTVEQVNELTSDAITVSATEGGVDADLISKMSGIDGVTGVVPITSAPATIDGTETTISGADPTALEKATGLDTTSGSLDSLTAGGIALSPFAGLATGPGPTSTVTPSSAATRTVVVMPVGATATTLPVSAELEFSITTLTIGTLVSPATFEKLFGTVAPSTVFVTSDATDTSQVGDALDTLTADYANIIVTRGNAFGEALESLFNFLINAVIALLGMSVIIAVIGIVNTLSLSIFEQRREIGMLRAVGMLPRDVRRMVRLEAVLISMVGTLTGLVAGVFLAFTMTRTLDAGFSLRPATLATILAIGVAVGFLASVAPARRVTRIDLLEALRA